MEDIRDFGMDLKEEIMNAVPDDIRNSLTLKETEVTKINDQKLYGLMFKRDGSEASPAIYVNQFFDRFRNGESIKTIAGEMVDLYLNSITDKEPKMPKALDFDDVKDHLTIRVIDIRKNYFTIFIFIIITFRFNYNSISPIMNNSSMFITFSINSSIS